ncbi:hypothetical protein D3C73_1594950 [compost metagenome]
MPGAGQQVQVGLRDIGDQLGALQCDAFWLFGVHNYEDATDGLHDRLPECASFITLVAIRRI